MIGIKKLVRTALNRCGIEVRIARNVRAANRKAWEERWAEQWRFAQRYDIRTVIDVGANTGQFARMIRRVFPDARLLCFEPLKECFRALEQGLAALPPAKGFHLALGSKTNTVEMHRSNFTPSSSILTMADLHKEEWPQSACHSPERVNVARLDDVLVGEDVVRDVLIKVDVQGYEGEVIRGGEQAIRNAAVAVIETSFRELYNGQPLFDDVYRMMRDLGFAYCGSADQHASHRNGEVMFADAIFENQSG